MRRHDQGLVDPLSIGVLVLIAVMMLVGGIALSVGVKCDPTVQRCLEHQHGPVQPEER